MNRVMSLGLVLDRLQPKGVLAGISASPHFISNLVFASHQILLKLSLWRKSLRQVACTYVM